MRGSSQCSAQLDVRKLTACPTCDEVWLNANQSTGPYAFEPVAHLITSLAPAIVASGNDRQRVNVLLEFAEPKS